MPESSDDTIRSLRSELAAANRRISELESELAAAKRVPLVDRLAREIGLVPEALQLAVRAPDPRNPLELRVEDGDLVVWDNELEAPSRTTPREYVAGLAERYSYLRPGAGDDDDRRAADEPTGADPWARSMDENLRIGAAKARARAERS